MRAGGAHNHHQAGRTLPAFSPLPGPWLCRLNWSWSHVARSSTRKDGPGTISGNFPLFAAACHTPLPDKPTEGRKITLDSRQIARINRIPVIYGSLYVLKAKRVWLTNNFLQSKLTSQTDLYQKEQKIKDFLVMSVF